MATKPSVPKLQSTDDVMNRFQTLLSSSLAPITGNPFSHPTRLTSITLVAGMNQVPHTLGYPLTGWVLTRVRAQATIWDDQGNSPDTSSFLILYSTAAVTVDIAVY